eukprot:1714764-Pyramimonas_sp.AAC.1
MSIDPTVTQGSCSLPTHVTNQAGQGRIQLFSEVYKHRMMILLQQALAASSDDPRRQATVEAHSVRPEEFGKKRARRPRR